MQLSNGSDGHTFESVTRAVGYPLREELQIRLQQESRDSISTIVSKRGRSDRGVRLSSHPRLGMVDSDTHI
jgi:hypothetical protein